MLDPQQPRAGPPDCRHRSTGISECLSTIPYARGGGGGQRNDVPPSLNISLNIHERPLKELLSKMSGPACAFTSSIRFSAGKTLANMWPKYAHAGRNRCNSGRQGHYRPTPIDDGRPTHESHFENANKGRTVSLKNTDKNSEPKSSESWPCLGPRDPLCCAPVEHRKTSEWRRRGRTRETPALSGPREGWRHVSSSAPRLSAHQRQVAPVAPTVPQFRAQ